MEREIPIRIPSLEKFRGVLPIGLTFDADSRWLLVAEAGINAVGVIDTRTHRVLGHLPAAWFPSRIAVHQGVAYVANARGNGAGPNHLGTPFDSTALLDTFRRGSVSVFPLPGAEEMERHTRTVMEANGFLPRPEAVPALPKAVRHVVLIVKENRTFDEVFGDIARAGNGPVMGAPSLARFGHDGGADGDRQRLSLHHINVTPNHHAIAQRWTFSDNFYADSDVSVDGHHWLVGSYPNAWTQSSLMAAYGGQKKFRVSHPGSGKAVVRRTPIPRCTPRSSWRPALSGITWLATASRSAISARASNLPEWTKARASSLPAPVSSPMCPCPRRCLRTHRASTPGST